MHEPAGTPDATHFRTPEQKLDGREQSFPGLTRVNVVREAANSQRHQGGGTKVPIDAERERRANLTNPAGDGGWQNEVL